MADIRLLTEPELAQACADRHPAAQAELYRRFAPTLLTVCRRYGQDRAEAQDMTQQAWLRAFERIKTYKSEGSLEGWLRRLFVRCCLTEVSRRRRRLDFIEPLPEDAEPEVAALAPPQDFLAAERLIEAIAALPDGARLVFNLFAVEGFSHAEIAVELGIRQEASRAQLLRARRLLGQRLGFTPQTSNAQTITRSA